MTRFITINYTPDALVMNEYDTQVEFATAVTADDLQYGFSSAQADMTVATNFALTPQLQAGLFQLLRIVNRQLLQPKIKQEYPRVDAAVRIREDYDADSSAPKLFLFRVKLAQRNREVGYLKQRLPEYGDDWWAVEFPNISTQVAFHINDLDHVVM